MESAAGSAACEDYGMIRLFTHIFAVILGSFIAIASQSDTSSNLCFWCIIGAVVCVLLVGFGWAADDMDL